MIDGSEKRNRLLAFELQNSHVCEKRSNNKNKNAECVECEVLFYRCDVLFYRCDFSFPGNTYRESYHLLTRGPRFVCKPTKDILTAFDYHKGW